MDLASLYDNNVTLKVEGKPIASGSLVIVNDRYGVKINNVIAQGQGGGAPQAQASAGEDVEEQAADNYTQEEEAPMPQVPEDSGQEGSDEEFDYSDFELEDENI